MGSDIENQITVDNFERFVDDPPLRKHLLLVDTPTLDAAVKAAEKIRIVGHSSSRSQGHSKSYCYCSVWKLGCFGGEKEIKIRRLIYEH